MRTASRTPTGWLRRLPAAAPRTRSVLLVTLAQIGGFARGGHANYNSLQALFRSQAGPSTFQAAYTWSHSIGNVELDNSSGSFNQQAVTDQYNPGLDKGNTNINRPNIFVASEVLYLPEAAAIQQLGAADTGWMGGQQHLHHWLRAARSPSSPMAQRFGRYRFNGSASSDLKRSLWERAITGNLRPLAYTDSVATTGRHGDQFRERCSTSRCIGYVLGTFPD